MAGILGTNFAGQHWRASADRSETIARARAARDVLQHRGPDFAGDFYDDRFFLGHAEQAGIDSGVVGRLPLASADAGATLTLDGHISNAFELRQSLAKRHAFHGNGGAEVVLQAYLQWGFDGMLERLRGNFALAIYDRTNAQVLLARDAMGSRPLYYLHEVRVNVPVLISTAGLAQCKPIGRCQNPMQHSITPRQIFWSAVKSCWQPLLRNAFLGQRLSLASVSALVPLPSG